MATLTFGQQIAFAERNLTRGLHATLAKHDVQGETWYALITLSTNGPMPLDRLNDELAQAPATASVDELSEQGLVSITDGIVDLTPQGRELFGRIREVVQARTKETLGRFDAADIETTRRVLQVLADGA
jgi:DNA-binding MarR family transcriptional regulator